MFEQLFKSINERVALTEEEKELCKTFYTFRRLRKRQFLLQEGDVCKYNAFVEKGLLRSYTVDDKGNEHIIQFAAEGWWISDLYSFLTGVTSVYNIEALEDCELLLLTKSASDELLARLPKFESYQRILLQGAYIAMQRRIHASLNQTAEEKYLNIIDIYPDIIQRVPQHMVASYLGLTPETLSRVRKQLILPK
ncbi:MAG: Crp/Fnr family transcriptional regulator [Sphingobacteriales bacterium]|nr:Crp/Fnr family transcriptional regulator [Sphingobacteriales bacterium]